MVLRLLLTLILPRLPKLQNHSCLDHIFVHNNDNIITLINAGIIQTDITDHYAICVSLPIINHLTNKSNYVSRVDHDNIKALLEGENWTAVYL